MFKKIIFSLIGSILFLMILWVAIGYKEYGNDLVNHHINLYGMALRFRNNFVSYNILDDLNNIKNLTSSFNNYSLGHSLEKVFSIISGININDSGNDFFSFMIQAINILISPINSLLFGLTLFIYITGSSLILLVAIVNILIQILSFVLFPMFI